MIARASLRHFLHHPWQLALLVLGIALGVAVVTAIEVTADSARHSFRAAQSELFGKATHRIIADQPLDEQLYVALRKHPAGWRSAPVISAYVKDRHGGHQLFQLLGVDPLREQAFRAQLQRVQSGTQIGYAGLQRRAVALMAETAAQQIKLDVGDSLRLTTPSGPTEVVIAGLINDTGEPTLRTLLLMDIGQAQQMLAMAGTISHIDMILTPDEVAAVQQWLPDGVRLEATEAALAAQAQLTRALFFNLQALGLLALVVGMFLVFSSVSFSLNQRRPIFAILRMQGVTAQGLYRYLFAELIGIALVSIVAGILLGLGLSKLLLGLVVTTLSDLYITTPQTLFLVTPLTLGKVVGLALLGCFLASWKPCRVLATVPPHALQQRFTQERESQAQTRWLVRWLMPGLLLLALLFFTWSGSGLWGGFAAVAALLLAGALMMPMMVVGLSRLLVMVLKKWGGPLGSPIGLMIARDSTRQLSRTGVAAMALMIAISATVGIGGMVGSFRDAVQLWLQSRLNADVYVAQTRVLPGVRQALPDGFVQDLRQLEGVSAAADIRRIALQVEKQRVYLYGSQLPEQLRDAYQFVEGDSGQIWRDMQQPDHLLISEPLANRLNIQRGDDFSLMTPKGETRFTMAGVYYDYGSDSGRMLMGDQRFLAYWQVEPYGVALFLQDGHAAENIISTIRQRWGGELDLSLLSAREILARSVEVFNRTFVITDVLRLLALIVAFVGILGSLLAIQLERQHEVSLLKAVGFDRLQIGGLLLGQALLLGIAAGLVAIPVGEMLSWGLTAVIQLRAFGWSIPYQADWHNWWQAVLLAGSAAVLASTYPAWRFARQRGARRWE